MCVCELIYVQVSKIMCVCGMVCFVKVRVPTGKIVLELPAGMLDDDEGDFVGTAVREVCARI